MNYTQKDLNVMALTLWGEARNETDEGIIAVAWTIRNRAEADLWNDNKPDWWGEGIAGVCLKPWQFSCWNKGDPNRAKIDRLHRNYVLTSDDEALARCLRIARGVLEGEIPDPTHGATHYYAEYIATPSWAKGKTPSKIVGVHRFFNDVEDGYTPPNPTQGPDLMAQIRVIEAELQKLKEML